MKKALIIGVGADRGLGAQLAKRFAAEGLYVCVASRTLPRLEALVSEIEQTGGKATAFCTDATNEEQVIELFEKVGSDLFLAIYNVGNNFPGQIINMESNYFENSWNSCCFGGFLFGREAIRLHGPIGRGNTDLHRCKCFSTRASQFWCIQFSKGRSTHTCSGDG